jgi:NADPH:quinone reductase-like Zn-dependent oxidoreductase
MRAIVQSRYGPADRVLELREIDRPAIRDDEVLLRVRAASVHPDVWHVLTGRPYMLRVMGAGLLRPKNPVPGTDAAGHVEKVGSAVRRFEVGDEVFGEIIRGHQWKNGGAFAEYAAVPAASLAHKPSNVSFEHAAAVPTSGLIALQGIRDEGQVTAGQSVLINGAGGAVGSFAVQIAKAFGAEVTGVDSTEKQDLLRSIGADHVIDYMTEDFTQGGKRYDVIVDIPGNRSFEDLKRSLADDGRYVLIGHDSFGAKGNRWIGGTIGRILRLQLFAPFGRRDRGEEAAADSRDGLSVLTGLLEAGKITPAVDRVFPLNEVAEAIGYMEAGQVLGKLVIAI